MAKKTFYDVLQVSRSADPEIIKAAYKSLVQRYHPDKNPDNPDAEKNLKIINRAYEVLSDPVKRAGYDAALAEDDEDQLRQMDAATSANESKKSQTDSRAGNDANPFKEAERAAHFDRNTTLTKKRDYLWMLDLLPMAATADFFKSLVLTGFHGSPEASGWAVFFSMLLGGAVGYPLCHYARTKITKNMQSRRTVIFVSLSISLGLTLTILTTTVLLTKSASRFDPNTAVLVPKNANPLDDPNFGISTLPPSAVENIMASHAEFTGQSFKITLHNNNDWTVTNFHIFFYETEGKAGTVILTSTTPPEGTMGTEFEEKEMITSYGQSTIYLNLDPNKAYKWTLHDVKGYQP